MRLIITISTILAFATAAPQLNIYDPYSVKETPVLIAPLPPSQSRPLQKSDSAKDAIILRYDNDNIGLDGYNYFVETSDGQTKSEQAQLLNPGTDAQSLAVRGQYSYTGIDGVLYTVTYTADESGFHPQGAHLPAAP